MKEKISLSIATASKGRAAIAATIAVSFYSLFRLPEPSEITVAMGFGRLAGTDAPIHKQQRVSPQLIRQSIDNLNSQTGGNWLCVEVVGSSLIFAI